MAAEGMTPELMDKFVSPHGFDGTGDTPPLVAEACRAIARLRVKFVNQWTPGMASPLTVREVGELFNAAAVVAEWLREVTEARDTASDPAEIGARWTPEQWAKALEGGERAGRLQRYGARLRSWFPSGRIRCDHGPTELCCVQHDQEAPTYCVALPQPKEGTA